MHCGHRGLEEARRDRGIALRRVKSLESECKDLKELMIAMEQREVIYTLPHRGFVSFYSTSLFNKNFFSSFPNDEVMSLVTNAKKCVIE